MHSEQSNADLRWDQIGPGWAGPPGTILKERRALLSDALRRPSKPCASPTNRPWLHKTNSSQGNWGQLAPRQCSSVNEGIMGIRGSWSGNTSPGLVSFAIGGCSHKKLVLAKCCVPWCAFQLESSSNRGDPYLACKLYLQCVLVSNQPRPAVYCNKFLCIDEYLSTKECFTV